MRCTPMEAATFNQIYFQAGSAIVIVRLQDLRPTATKATVIGIGKAALLPLARMLAPRASMAV